MCRKYSSLAAIVGCTALLCRASPAQAQTVGSAASFAVVAGSAVNVNGTGATGGPMTIINGNVGVSPGSAITGLPSLGTVTPPFQGNATTYVPPSIADAAQAAAGTLFTDLSTYACVGTACAEPVDMTGRTFGPGAHDFIAGTVILPAGKNVTLSGTSTDIFIFRAKSDLTTFAGSTVTLLGGVNACNVYWQVPTQATIANDVAGFPFVGNVVAGTSVVLNAFANLNGRALALTAAVTMANHNLVGGCSGGSLTVIKSATGGNGTFSFTGVGPAFDITTSGGTGQVTISNVPPGTHTILETVPSGWTPGLNGCVNVVVPQAPDTVTCTVENSFQGAPNQIKVHILKYLDGVTATAASAGSYLFPMVSTWSATNLGAGSGSYVLGSSAGGASDQYGADTSLMDLGADYKTSEVTTGSSQVLATGAACVPGKFRLVGYSTSAVSFAGAAAAATAVGAPIFTGLQTDQYVIVRNITCPTTGTILVTKKTSSSSANGTFTFTGPNGSFAITTVGGTGTAAIPNLRPGLYSITEVSQNGWSLTSNGCASVTVTAGAVSNCTVKNTVKLCESILPTVSVLSIAPGPPVVVTLKVQDAGGLQSIAVLVNTNANVVVPSFTVGTTAPVYVTATKIDQSQGSAVGVKATDLCGNVTIFDPVSVTVNPGKRQAVLLTDVPGDETLVTIINDGLDAVRITVNGQPRIIQMRRGETRKVDISDAMLPGDDNTILLEARGARNASALVTVAPPPAASESEETARRDRRNRSHKHAQVVDVR